MSPQTHGFGRTVTLACRVTAALGLVAIDRKSVV